MRIKNIDINFNPSCNENLNSKGNINKHPVMLPLLTVSLIIPKLIDMSNLLLKSAIEESKLTIKKTLLCYKL